MVNITIVSTVSKVSSVEIKGVIESKRPALNRSVA